MISTFLVTHAGLVPVVFWFSVILSGALGWLLYRLNQQRALLILAIIGLVGPLVLTLSPSVAEVESACAVQFSVPFLGIDTLANLAMLIPGTLFAALRFRRPPVIFAAASGLSALIELTQVLIPALGRVCDTDDWFMNTIGATIGALLAAAIIAVDTRRRRAKTATLERSITD
jgi:glycopeptide antibiotics resistance protein